jgi:hypothetical protein
MESNQNLLTSELQVDAIASSHLQETAKWAKFLAVAGIILSIIIGLAGLFAGSILSSMTRGFGNSNPMGAAASGMVTIFYLFIAAVYFFLSLYLYRFAVKMRLALQTSDQQNFNDSLLNLKLVYRIMGIILIIYLGLIALLLIVSIMTAAFMR